MHSMTFERCSADLVECQLCVEVYRNGFKLKLLAEDFFSDKRA